MTISSASILIVEDDASLREALAEFLRHEGYGVLTAEGGEVALAAASATNFDIILSDIEMDNGSGLWLLQELNEQKTSALVILMSANTSFTNESARALGANRFIAKPFRMKVVLSVLKEALLSREERSEMVSIKTAQE